MRDFEVVVRVPVFGLELEDEIHFFDDPVTFMLDSDFFDDADVESITEIH